MFTQNLLQRNTHSNRVIALLFTAFFGILLLNFSRGSWYSSGIEDINMVVHLNFSAVDSSNVTADGSGYGNDGTLKNYPCAPATCNLTSARYGDGLYFDGTDDYVTIATSSSSDVNATFSYSMWFKIPSDIPSMATFFARRATAQIACRMGWISQDGSIYCWTYDGSNKVESMPSGSYKDNKWHHLVYDRNGTHLNVYIDGVLKDSDADTTWGNSMPTGVTTYVGTDEPSRYFNGTMDDFRVYNQSLTLAEVRELYSCKYPDQGEWRINGICNIQSENINNSTMTIIIESTGELTLLDTPVEVDRIIIANGGKFASNSTWGVV